jgi:mannose-6-phosphate isomerase-like protein (cupin superfamily)
MAVAPAMALGAGATASAAPITAPRSAVSTATVVDPGEVPYVFDVERAALENTNFRTAAWTADQLQLTLMSIPVGGDVGLEMHPATNQFFRIEAGTARVTMGTKTILSYVKTAGPGDVVMIPAGTWHNLANINSKPLKMYSLYGPQQHPRGTVHRTQADDPHSGDPKPAPRVAAPTQIKPFRADPGALPFVFDIDQATAANPNFRTTAWTSSTLQLTLMDIPVDGDVGLEMHSTVDQFLRIESGSAKVYTGSSEGAIRPLAVAHAGDAIMIPSGTWHNIVNIGHEDPLELYSLYGPQQHPKGTIHVTKPKE